MLENKTIFITGGAGFIANTIISRLVEKNKIVVYDNFHRDTLTGSVYANHKNIKVVNDQWRTPTLAEDLAMGCLLAVEKKAQGIYNISGSDFLSPYDIAQKTALFFKLDASLIEKADSSTFTQTAKRPPKTGFVIDKAIHDLGYKPHTFEEGLQLLSTQILNA